MSLIIFSSVLLPLVIVAAAGYALGRWRHIDPRPLADAVFYVLNPALAFVTLSTSTVEPAMLGRLILLKLAAIALTLPLASLGARALRLSAPTTSALLLAAAFSNSGNFGLPANEYAFGKQGLAFAVICFVTDNLVTNSVGVYIAARGHVSVRVALLRVLENPALLAVPLGLLVNQTGWVSPLWLHRSMTLLSQAATPVMILILGVQISRMPARLSHARATGVAVILKLIVMPLIAFGLSGPLGLTGLAQKVGLMQTAMPTAVMPTMLATKYESEPGLVAGSLLVSTAAGLLTLTALLSMMG